MCVWVGEGVIVSHTWRLVFHHKVVDMVPQPVHVSGLITIHKDAVLINARVGKSVDIVVHIEFLELGTEGGNGLTALARGNTVDMRPNDYDRGAGSTALQVLER